MKRDAEWWKEYRAKRAAEREANRPTLVCKGCREPFEPTTPTQRHCSNRCRQLAHRLREGQRKRVAVTPLRNNVTQSLANH
jgi:uncharacterized protein (DUF3084 family)